MHIELENPREIALQILLHLSGIVSRVLYGYIQRLAGAIQGTADSPQNDPEVHVPEAVADKE
jgi:hypothetical protein